MKLIASLALIVFYSSLVLAQQPHVHGQNAVDWYDPSCCSNKDCHPVENDSDIEFGTDTNGNTYARYKPTNNIFYRHQFKPSQDERYHVCINAAAADNAGALCFYDRSGA